MMTDLLQLSAFILLMALAACAVHLRNQREAAPAEEREPSGFLNSVFRRGSTMSNMRCDRCGARALVGIRLTKTQTELGFCGHHYAAHSAALEACAEIVFDEREKVLT